MLQVTVKLCSNAEFFLYGLDSFHCEYGDYEVEDDCVDAVVDDDDDDVVNLARCLSAMS